MKALIALFFVLVAFVYAGTGWTITWLIDLVTDANVNYTAGVVAGLIIYLICVIPIILLFMAAKKADKELEKMNKIVE